MLTTQKKTSRMGGNMRRIISAGNEPNYGRDVLVWGILSVISFTFLCGGCIARIPKESVMISAEVSKGIAEGRRQHMATLDQVVTACEETILLEMDTWFLETLPVVAAGMDINKAVCEAPGDYKNMKKMKKFILGAARAFTKEHNKRLAELHGQERKQRAKIRDYWDWVLDMANVIRDNIRAVTDVQSIQDAILKKIGAPPVLIDPVGEIGKEIKNK